MEGGELNLGEVEGLGTSNLPIIPFASYILVLGDG
jgi:hypothetical protein